MSVTKKEIRRAKKIVKEDRLRRRKQAQIWVSAISYILITVVIIVLLLNTGIPLLEKIKDRSIYSKTKDMFLSIDQQVKDVQSEGPGAQRVIPIEIKKGEMTIEDNQIKWSMESTAKIIEPRTKIFVGDLIVGDDSFITFEDGKTLFEDDFGSKNLDGTKWRLVDSCSGNDITLNGKLTANDGCNSLTDNYVISHENVTNQDDLSFTFTFNTGDTLSNDVGVIGLANESNELSTADNNLVHGFVFNESGSVGEIHTYERGTTNYVYNYTTDTNYYFKIKKTVVNGHQQTQFLVSEDNTDWILLRQNTTTVGAENDIYKPFVTVADGEFTIDNVKAVDDTYYVNNSYLSVALRKQTGSPGRYHYLNTSDVMKYMKYTSTNTTLTGENLTFSINNVPQSSYGNGYVTLSELRTDPDAIVLIAHVNSTATGDHYEYDLMMTLEGGVDFLVINVENLAINE